MYDTTGLAADTDICYIFARTPCRVRARIFDLFDLCAQWGGRERRYKGTSGACLFIRPSTVDCYPLQAKDTLVEFF